MHAESGQVFIFLIFHRKKGFYDEIEGHQKKKKNDEKSKSSEHILCFSSANSSFGLPNHCRKLIKMLRQKKLTSK